MARILQGRGKFIAGAVSFATAAALTIVIGVVSQGNDLLTAWLYTEWFGQSNALGNNTIAVTTTQPYANERHTGTNGSNGANVPLVETPLESPASNMCNTVTRNIPGASCLAHNFAVSATAYAAMAPGTAPFNNAIAARAYARALFAAAHPGEELIDGPMHGNHGESDSALGRTAAQYAADMVTWRNGWQTATGVTSHTIPMVHVQMANFTLLNPRQDHSTVGMGQWDVCRANPTTHWCSHPAYAIAHTTNDLHYNEDTSDGQLMNACWHAKVDYTFRSGLVWRGLGPDTITCNANVITVSVTGGRGESDLVFDQTYVQPHENYGFEYFDTQADMPTISSVALDGRDILITLNRNCEAGFRLRYAYSGVPGSSAGRTFPGAAGGNIRNQDDWPCDHGGTAPDWLFGFDEAGTECTNCTPSATPLYANTQSYQGVAGDWLSAGDDAVLDGATGATWMIRFRIDTALPGSDQGLIAKNDTGHRQFDLRMRSGGQPRMFISPNVTDATVIFDFPATIVVGSSYLLGVTYTGGGTPSVQCWLQGQPITCTQSGAGSLPAALTTGTTSELSIGSTSVGGAVCTNCRIGQVALWRNYVATAADWRQLYNGGDFSDPMLLATQPNRNWQLQGTLDDLGTTTPSRPLRMIGATSPTWNAGQMLATRSAGCGLTPPCTAGSVCDGGAGQTMTSAGISRTWVASVPSTYSNTVARRAVFGWHGCAFLASSYRTADGIPFELRDLNLSLYFYLQGRNGVHACSAGPGWEFESDFGTNEDLVAMGDWMDRIEQTYCVLPQHVHRGTSLGAGFLGAASSEYENRIAAVIQHMGGTFEAAFVSQNEFNGTTPTLFDYNGNDFTYNSIYSRSDCAQKYGAALGLSTPVACVTTTGGGGNPQTDGGPLDGSLANGCGIGMESDAGHPSCAATGRVGLCCRASADGGSRNIDGGAVITLCECQTGEHNALGSGDAGTNGFHQVWAGINQQPRNFP